MTSPNWSESGSKWNRFGHATIGSPLRALISVVVLVSAVTLGGWAFGWFSADVRGELDAREQILADGDFRIQAYQGFFDKCAGIQAQEARAGLFAADDGPLASTNLNAILAIRSELVAEYNGLAAREWTEGQFRDEDLPFKIELVWTPGNEETKCAR